jgi:hypothetical protein
MQRPAGTSKVDTRPSFEQFFVITSSSRFLKNLKQFKELAIVPLTVLSDFSKPWN